MDAIDAGYPRLYRAASLTIRPTRNLLDGGEYHDEHGLRVGSFTVRNPRDGRWGDHRASAITEILDGDSTVFMVVAHRKSDFVIADPDHTELATLRPNLQLLGRRLRVHVALVDHGTGSLRELRRAPKRQRAYSLSFGPEPPAARITTSLLRQAESEAVALVHDAAASPPQRCASLALATCIPQMIVTGPIVGGAGYGG